MRSARTFVALVALWSAASGGAATGEAAPPSRAWVRISSAELAAQYDTLWAVSDVHAHAGELEQLLLASGLVVRHGPTIAWSRDARRALLLVVGDLIDGGPDSVGVVLLLERLQREAAAANDRVVVLLGNHEAKLLAHPRSSSPELRASAERHAAELGWSRRLTRHLLDAQPFGAFLRELPVAAIVGSWLFAHAGCVGGGGDAPGADAWLTRLDATVAPRDVTAFAALLDPRSIVACRGWWRSAKQLALARTRLQALDLDGLLFGHEPDVLGAPGTIAMNRDGWFVKLDSGLKSGASRGMLLRCEVRDIVQLDRLAMSRDGAPTCRVLTPDGDTRALPVR